MSWITLDDRFLDHPKFIDAVVRGGSPALHLWLGMMQHCKLHQTDGYVRRDMVLKVNGPAQRWRTRALEALTESGLVEDLGEDLLMHDYLDWNDSRQEIEQRADERRERRGSGRRASEERRSRDGGASEERRRSVEGAFSTSSENGQLALDGSTPYPTPPEPTLTNAAMDPPQPPVSGKRAKGPKGHSKVPADFAPDAAGIELATKLGFTERLELKTRDEFVDWWKGVGKMRSDWQATYRNRLRAVADKLGLKPPRRDERWAHHQENLRKADAPVAKVAKPPPGYDTKVRSLFG